MRPRTLFTIVPLAVVIGLGVVLRGEPAAVRIAATIGLAYVAIAALAVARRQFPPASHSLLPGQTQAPRGNGQSLLSSLESTIILSRSSAVDYERRLRPILFRAASGRLAAKGVIWEREPEQVEALIGERVSRLLRPPDGLPERNRRGPATEEIEEIVSRIEEV